MPGDVTCAFVQPKPSFGAETCVPLSSCFSMCFNVCVFFQFIFLRQAELEERIDTLTLIESIERWNVKIREACSWFPVSGDICPRDPVVPNLRYGEDGDYLCRRQEGPVVSSEVRYVDP